jgi:hypothetical protein
MDKDVDAGNNAHRAAYDLLLDVRAAKRIAVVEINGVWQSGPLDLPNEVSAFREINALALAAIEMPGLWFRTAPQVS